MTHHPLTSVRLIAVLGLLALAGPTWALTLSCNSEIVNAGDRTYDVLRKCGAPDFVDRWFEGLAFGYPFGIEVEEWYYEFTPNRLVRMLRFRNGRLVTVETGGYSFGDDIRGTCQPEAIEPGLSKFELLVLCGEPDARESWMEFRSERVGDVYTQPISVRMDEWIYAFGSNRFIRYVTLVNGRITQVETGERDE
jgi:hypothetical protein